MEFAQRYDDREGVIRQRSLTKKLTRDKDLPDDIVTALWQGPPDRIVASSKPLQVKNRTVVVRYDHAEASFVFKRHIWGGLTRTLRKMYREPSARRCGRLGRYLAQRGIPTPRPRASLEHCLGPFTYRSYLLIDYVEGTSLFHYIRSESLPDSDVRQLASQVVNIWRRLVELNISHNDLKPENFIVDRSGKVWLIDLERVRFHRHAAQLRRRHLEDARIFLHIRNWRDQLEAAEVFRQEIASTLLEMRVVSDTSEEHRLFHKGYSEHELTCRISVAIIADPGAADQGAMTRSIRSVRDMADEIVLVNPSAPAGEFRVVDLETTQQGEQLGRGDSFQSDSKRRQAEAVRHPWVLVLRAGECATPALVRELPERIVDEPDCDAVRIPIDEVIFGRATRPHAKPRLAPIRAFHRERCPFHLRNGNLIVTVDQNRTALSPYKIQDHVFLRFHTYIDKLNEQSTNSASAGLGQSDRPRLVAGFAWAVGRFLRDYVLHGAYRRGWIGLQISLVNAMFVWLREAKLWQISSGFHAVDESPDPSEESGAAAADREGDPRILSSSRAA